MVPVGLALQDLGDQVGSRFTFEQWAAAQALEQQAPEGPNIGALVHRLAARLLGTHVGGGSENHSGLGRGVGQCR